jgi:hypothetical protein
VKHYLDDRQQVLDPSAPLPALDLPMRPLSLRTMPCRARRKDGQPCQAMVYPDERGYCSSHRSQRPPAAPATAAQSAE